LTRHNAPPTSHPSKQT